MVIAPVRSNGRWYVGFGDGSGIPARSSQSLNPGLEAWEMMLAQVFDAERDEVHPCAIEKFSRPDIATAFSMYRTCAKSNRCYSRDIVRRACQYLRSRGDCRR